MYAPGTRPATSIHYGQIVPIGIAIVIAGVAIGAWAAFDVRTTGDPPTIPVASPSSKDSVAFISRDGDADRIYVRKAVPGATQRLIDVFPVAEKRARASVSPIGDSLAVLWMPTSGSTASLALVSIPRKERQDLDGAFDHGSNFAWSADGRRLALSRSSAPNQSGRLNAQILEVDILSGTSHLVVEVPEVFDAEPVGYSPAGWLYVVTVDSAGSRLWEVREGALRPVSAFSVGRTNGWTVSQDRSRLAFLDILGSGSARSAIARVLLIATGEVTEVPGSDDQFGIAWQPGVAMPSVGGPGGSVQLQGEESDRAFLVPAAWSEDGDRLLARVIHPDEAGTATESLEVVNHEVRLKIVDSREAVPLGWVVDVE